MKNIFEKIGKLFKKTEKKSEKKEVYHKKAVIKGVQSLSNPMEGCIIDLEQVPEAVFSGKQLGDGFAIEPTGSEVYSPVDGEIIVLFPTKHAIVVLSEEGLQVLIHIGINTVGLQGEGFDVHVKKGDKVKKGDLLISFDAEFIKTSGKSLVSPVIITNADVVKQLSVEYGTRNAKEQIATVTIG